MAGGVSVRGMTLTLDGKTAIVTGGSRGIGRAIVRRLAAGGARVVYTYVNGPGEAVAGAEAVRADLASLGAIFERVADGLDILVNNAAAADRKIIADLGPADIERAMTVNFTFP